MKNKIDSKIQNGYTLDIDTLIDDSINTFKKTSLISGIAVILIGILFFIIYVAIIGIIYGFSNLTDTFTELQTNQFSLQALLITTILSTITSALFAPMTAGFIHANHLAKNNQEIGINVFFDFYKSKFFKDIFITYLIIGLTIGLLNYVFVMIKMDYLSFVAQFLINLFTIFTLPLIIYSEQNYEKAIVKSAQLFLKQPILIFVALLLAVIGVFLGIIALCIGIIFTLPYYYSMVYAIYNQAIGFEEKSVIDEIGLI